MARTEVEWVSFGRGVRLGGSSTEAAACARSGSVKIFKVATADGVCLSIEEKGKPPIVVPWHSVGSIVCVAPVDVPAPTLAKASAKKAVEAVP